MFSLAVKAERLTWRPAITLLDESDNVGEGFFEPAEFEAVCRHLPCDVADAATFGYLTGWRRGEVVGLEWGRVTLGDEWGTIQLPPKRSKNKKPRTLILTGDLLALIQPTDFKCFAGADNQAILQCLSPIKCWTV